MKRVSLKEELEIKQKEIDDFKITFDDNMKKIIEDKNLEYKELLSKKDQKIDEQLSEIIKTTKQYENILK